MIVLMIVLILLIIFFLPIVVVVVLLFYRSFLRHLWLVAEAFGWVRRRRVESGSPGAKVITAKSGCPYLKVGGQA